MDYKDKASYGLAASGAIGWRRAIGCLIFIVHFPPKSSIISGSFAKMSCDLRHPMNESSPSCTAGPYVHGISPFSKIYFGFGASVVAAASCIHVMSPCIHVSNPMTYVTDSMIELTNLIVYD